MFFGGAVFRVGDSKTRPTSMYYHNILIFDILVDKHRPHPLPVIVVPPCVEILD